jgi:glycosyltransferase involved in cell wall biosynthesis
MGSRSVIRRCLVVSAVNFTEGGPLTVLKEFVDSACSVLTADWDIVVFVHDRRLLSATRPRLIEIPYAKGSWIRRLWVEWYEFRGHARILQPDLWVSLHDISPNVGSVPQAVYCHNPAPFFRLRLRDALFEPTVLFFRLGYAWLYRINIKRNRAVIVQQSWLRDEFRKWVEKPTEIIVAHPAAASDTDSRRGWRKTAKGPATFFYPALPRALKNHELLCRAVEQLEAHTPWRSQVILTVDGTENRYARWLKARYGRLRTVRFVGRQSSVQMQERYAEADCLVFPSRMETWGLPITEARRHQLPMFVADLPYAKETVGSYHAVDFIDVDDDDALARKLLAFQDGDLQFRPTFSGPPEQPFASDWTGLIRMLVSGLSHRPAVVGANGET